MTIWVERTSTYPSNIENGDNQPLEQELLGSLIETMSQSRHVSVTQIRYDLAAQARGNIPFDVKQLFYGKPVIIPMLHFVKIDPNGEALLNQPVHQI